jgi:hypothetical protein
MDKTILINLPEELYRKALSFLNEKKMGLNEWLIFLIDNSLKNNVHPAVESFFDLSFSSSNASAKSGKIEPPENR